MSRQPLCAYCGAPFVRHREDQICCPAGSNTTNNPGRSCKDDLKNLERTRGMKIYRAIYWWRYKRNDHSLADNLRFITREIRSWIEEDKAAGRPPPPRHRHDLDRGYQRKAIIPEDGLKGDAGSHLKMYK